jgi:hypothetical protein
MISIDEFNELLVRIATLGIYNLQKSEEDMMKEKPLGKKHNIS